MKRALALILALVMLIELFPMQILASENEGKRSITTRLASHPWI